MVHKIIIYSRDRHYALYLQSLIQQVQAVPGLSIQIYPGSGNDLQCAAENSLLIIYLQTDRELNKEVAAIQAHSQKIIISNNGLGLKSQDIQIGFFARPLDEEEFLQGVHQWCLKHCLCEAPEQQAPQEPYLMGNSAAICMLRNNVFRLSKTNLTVLICGDTGTGKGLVARALHNNSPSKCNPFLDINCANVPSSLLESELFGYKKGSFTGAWQDKPGRFEMVQEGTIFLDEISEMPNQMQAKLLQVLQEKEFYPIGGTESVKLQVRLLAASNSDLKKAISQGRFREDLYFRLAVVRLNLPSLKDRKEDVPVLVQHFLDKFCRVYNKQLIPRLSDELWSLLLAYDWPGNVRELENSIKTLVALEDEEMLKERLHSKLTARTGPRKEELESRPVSSLQDLALTSKAASCHDLSLKKLTNQAVEKVEAELIAKALRQTRGNKKKAANILDVSYKCLLKKIKTYGV